MLGDATITSGPECAVLCSCRRRLRRSLLVFRNIQIRGHAKNLAKRIVCEGRREGPWGGGEGGAEFVEGPSEQRVG